MTVGKVKDFNFSSSGKTVGLCSGGSWGKTKYAKGGQAVQMAKSNAIKKSMEGQKMTKMASGGYYAKGGKAIGGPITEEMTGETYPSRSAMVKHESLETPRMQKQEMVQKSTVRAPAAKMKAGRAAAGKAAIPPQMPMKKGGVKKFADGGPAGMPAGALAQLQAAMSQQKMPADAKAKMQMMARAAMAQKMAQAQGRPPMAPPQGMPMPTGRPAMKKGGFVERGTGMIPNKGTLGVKGNKNPGEMGGKAPVKSHPKYNYADGGPVERAGRQVLPSRPVAPPRPPMGGQLSEDARKSSMEQYRKSLQNSFKSLSPDQQQQYLQKNQQQIGMTPQAFQQMVNSPSMAPPMGQQPPRPQMGGQLGVASGNASMDQYMRQLQNAGPPPMGQQNGLQQMSLLDQARTSYAPQFAQQQPPMGQQQQPPMSQQQQLQQLRAMVMAPPMGQSAGQMQPPTNNPFGNLSGGFNVGQPMGNQQASNMMQNYSAQMAQQPPQGMPMQQPMGQSGAVSSMPPQRMGGIG